MWRPTTRIRGCKIDRATPLGALFPAGGPAAAILIILISADILTGDVRPWTFIYALAKAFVIGSIVYASIDIRTGAGFHCNRCGYPAQGLDAADACPECNLDWTDGAGLRRGAAWRSRERWAAVITSSTIFIVIAITKIYVYFSR